MSVHSTVFDERYNYAPVPPELASEVADTYRVATPTTIRAFLQAQGADYRTTPLYLSTGSRLTRRDCLERPIVASEAMCTAPAVDGGADEPSPNALICDQYHDVVVTANGAAEVSTGTPTDTLAVDALDRDLPIGFCLNFGGEYVQLDAAASEGATSISIRRATSAGATIADNDTGTAAHRYYAQGGVLATRIVGAMLYGDPDPYISEDPSQESARKYACDGIHLSGLGHLADDFAISNLPGHAIYIAPIGAETTRAGRHVAWENFANIVGFGFISQCLTGITVGANDCSVGSGQKLVIEHCRDAALRTKTGTKTTLGNIHGGGIGSTAFKFSGSVQGGHIECDSNVGGADFLSGSEGTEGISITSYSNTSTCVRAYVGNSHFTSMLLDHSAGNECLLVGRYADTSHFAWVRARAAGTANGITIGDATTRTCLNLRMVACVSKAAAGTGTRGYQLVCPLSAPDLTLSFPGGADAEAQYGAFTTGFYQGNSAAIAGGRIRLYGPSSTAIRWYDTTTGTFGTPNFPSGYSDIFRISPF